MLNLFTSRNDMMRAAAVSAFAVMQAMEAQRLAKPSKRHPVEDSATGPEAAAKYRQRHPPGAMKLRQAMRAARIEAGDRPLKFDVPGKRERKVAARCAAREAVVSATERRALRRFACGL
jgi:hypothetical protein